jgi:hypothetical protein
VKEQRKGAKTQGRKGDLDFRRQDVYVRGEERINCYANTQHIQDHIEIARDTLDPRGNAAIQERHRQT